MRIHRILLLCLIVLTPFCGGEVITVATYNVEHFAGHFDADEMRKWATSQPNAEELKPWVTAEKKHNDEDNWEVAQVIQDDRFDPDIIVFEECCDEKDLQHFNKRWLKSEYETVMVFPSNSTRAQYVGMMLKPGFKVLEKKDQYYLEPDTVANERGERLFARGPAFCKVKTPGGYEFWVGVTHQKSKFDNNAEVTAWRNREAKRTHQILKELQTAGPADVMLLGDMNDEVGEQEFEHDNGGDSIANLVGPPEDGFTLATQPLVDEKKNSFGGYWVPTYRSLIDHIIVSSHMKTRIESVHLFNPPLARVASDHFPVYAKIKTDAPATQPATTQASP